MDDTSRQQLDELAELYLTHLVEGTDGPKAAPSPIEGPPPIRLSPKPGNAKAWSREEAARRDLTTQAPPLRLIDPADNPIPINQSQVDEDAAVATLLSEDNSSGREKEAPIAPAPKAVVEAVLLGNLPGMSGPWLTQYAQLLAQTDGPVALLHVEDYAIDLELIEPRLEAEPRPAQPMSAVRIPPMREGQSGLVGLLDALVRSESAPTRTVLVRIDASTDARTLSRLAALDDWTILCGADEASVAGTCQQLRSLVHADPRLADRHVGLMVMGSDELTAQQAGRRIADELEQDLVNPIELIGHLKRMQPVQVREIGSFPDPVGLWPQLVAWFDRLETPQLQPIPESVPLTPLQAPAPTPQSAPQAAPQHAQVAAPVSRPAPVPTFRPTPPAAARTANPAPAIPVAPAAQRAEPGTARTATPRATTPTRPAPRPRVLPAPHELDLVALLAQGPAALSGAITLEARIPDQPEAQLAVDAQGVVHILARNDSQASSSDTRQAVMHLIEAGRWVQQNLELLALTQRDVSFVDQAPQLHLLTDRADQATSMVGKLSGQVRFHLLQQVQVGRETGWFCTPLG